MKSKYGTSTELTLKGLILFAILTVIQGLPALENINKIWLAAVAIALLVCMFMYRYNRVQVLVLFLTFVLHLVALGLTEFPLYHVNILFYFALWVLIYMYFVKSKNNIFRILKSSDKYIVFVLSTWTIIVGFSALLPSSYHNRYFYSFSGDSFRIMPASLIVMALAMYMAITRGNKRYNWYLLLPTYAAFMNRSRVYFGIFLIFMLMYMYMAIKKKQHFYLLLIPVTFVVLIIMSVSGIADKFEASRYTEKSYFDFWGTITSGRTVFWVWDLKAFFSLPFWQQFVGNGFNYVYEVNDAQMNAIWAHNDIINLLLNFGYIGVFIYCWAFWMLVKVYWPQGNKVPRVVKIMFLSAVLINSMMNMSYTYMCAMISYPLYLCAISCRYDLCPDA